MKPAAWKNFAALVAVLVAASAAEAGTPEDGWSLALAGEDQRALDAFLAQLAQEPENLEAAVGLAALLEGRNDTEGAMGVLLRGLESPARGPLYAGALAQALALASRAPDGGAAALPLLESIISGRKPVPDPELKSLAGLGLADILIRIGRPEEAREMLFSRGGRLQSWSLLGPYGKFGKLDLHRPQAPERGDLHPEDDPPGTANLAPWRLDTFFLDGRVAVPPQFAGFGVVYLVADVQVEEAGEYRLRVASESSLALFVDGRPVAVLDRYLDNPPSAAGFLARLGPGRHRLMVKLARAGADNLVAVSLEPAGEEKTAPLRNVPLADEPLGESAVTGWPVPFDQPADSPLPAETLAAAWWLRSRHLDRPQGDILERAVQQNPRAHLFALALAEFLRTGETGADPQRDLARARALFEKLAESGTQGARARLQIARMDLDADRLTEAWQGAEKVLAISPEDPDALLLQHRIAVQRGWNTEADQRIERARAAAPGRGDLLQAAADFFRRIGARSRLNRVQEELARRDQSAQGRAEWLAAQGRDEEALAAWLQAIDQQPSFLGFAFEAARRAADLGRPEQGLQVLDRAAAQFPREAGIALRRAELLSQLGREAEATAQLAQALRENPSLVGIRQALHRRGVKDPLAAWGADARLILAEAKPPRAGADSALLADLSATLVHPQGGQTEFYQGIHRVYTRTGVEKEGELEILPGALLDFIRIYKTDGRILDVDPGSKRPVSLPNLSPQDSFEYIWRRFIPPSELIPGGLDNRTVFMFQGAERDFVLSRFAVLHDPGVPVTVCSNTHGLETTDTIQDGLRVRTWTARSVPELQPEPNIPDPMEVIPHVKLGLGVTVQDLGDLFESSLAGTLRLDAPLPAWAADIRARAPGSDPAALSRALFALVVSRVKPGGTPLRLGLAASASASAGEGNRIGVALALARELGLSPRLILTRPLALKGTDLKCPSPDMFGYALVEIPLPDRLVYLDFTEGNVPYDTFPPGLQGADGLRIGLDFRARAELIELPRRTGPAHQEFNARLELDAEGRARGTAEMIYRGFSSGRPRLWWQQLPGDRREEMLQELVSQWFPGGRVLESSVSGTEDSSPEFRFSFRIEGGTFARRTQTGFALPPVIQPLPLLSAYAAMESRRFPLLLDFLSFQGRIQVAFPEGLVPEELPAPVAVLGPFGVYRLEIRREAKELVLENLTQFPEQRIEPADYPAFRAAAQEIDRAEKTEIRLAAPSPLLR